MTLIKEYKMPHMSEMQTFSGYTRLPKMDALIYQENLQKFL